MGRNLMEPASPRHERLTGRHTHTKIPVHSLYIFVSYCTGSNSSYSMNNMCLCVCVGVSACYESLLAVLTDL